MEDKVVKPQQVGQKQRPPVGCKARSPPVRVGINTMWMSVGASFRRETWQDKRANKGHTTASRIVNFRSAESTFAAFHYMYNAHH